MALFRDRRHAGRLLAQSLGGYKDRDETIVIGLPRGGVPTAYEVAQSLHAPLDIFVVRKLGAPGHEELAMGAIAMGGVTFINSEVTSSLGISELDLAHSIALEGRELLRRVNAYRGTKPPLNVKGKYIVLVDDGLATGSTMLAAIKALRVLEPKGIVAAVPVAPPSTCARVRAAADEMVCLNYPESFDAVGMYYDDFSQTTDDEVRQLLAENASRLLRSAGWAPTVAPGPSGVTHDPSQRESPSLRPSARLAARRTDRAARRGA